MEPGGYRPLFHLPSRFGLTVAVAVTLTVVAGGRVALTDVHPQAALLDALTWAGATACVFAWYGALRALAERAHGRIERAVQSREQRLLDYRRSILIAAHGDRRVAKAVSRSWPAADDAGAMLAEILAHVTRGCAAFLLGIGLVALASGTTGTVYANLGVPPLALAVVLSAYSCLARWGHLGWRFLGWRRGLYDVRRAQAVLDTLE